MTRPYILRTEPTDSGESGYRPPSREWLKCRRAKRLNFEHLLDAEIKKTPFMARIESLRLYRWGNDPERRMVRTPKKGGVSE